MNLKVGIDIEKFIKNKDNLLKYGVYHIYFIKYTI